MSRPLNRKGFEVMVQGNLDWLALQPDTLESKHIKTILKGITELIYGPCSSCGHLAIDDAWEIHRDGGGE